MLTSRVRMVRPAAFGFSVEAAASNVFQRRSSLESGAVQARALAEFDGAVATLRAAGVEVLVAEDTPNPPKPDAVFPNNWFSTHPDGTAVLYPMAVPGRRAERRPELVPPARRVIDLSPLETTGAFLEGTGSLVLDHDRRLAYACLSPRTTPAGLAAFAEATGYTPVVFEYTLDGAPVYHTNVVLALGPDVALLGEEASPRPDLGDREVVLLSAPQLRAYAGNALWLATPAPRMVMSRTGWGTLSESQRRPLGEPILLDIPTIETVGGGSARCMLAELFF